MVSKSSTALNFALSTVVTYLKPEPFRNLTVKECLWGYEDPLVGFASKVLPSWINFEKFGLLDRVKQCQFVNLISVNFNFPKISTPANSSATDIFSTMH
jgi:hypothetical protein